MLGAKQRERSELVQKKVNPSAEKSERSEPVQNELQTKLERKARVSVASTRKKSHVNQNQNQTFDKLE